jgi:hypothetical protein
MARSERVPCGVRTSTTPHPSRPPADFITSARQLDVNGIRLLYLADPLYPTVIFAPVDSPACPPAAAFQPGELSIHTNSRNCNIYHIHPKAVQYTIKHLQAEKRSAPGSHPEVCVSLEMLCAVQECLRVYFVDHRHDIRATETGGRRPMETL